MALAIDASWDRMQVRAAERELLQRIHAELVDAREVLAESLRAKRFAPAALDFTSWSRSRIPNC
jgi:hypothetical protein